MGKTMVILWRLNYIQRLDCYLVSCFVLLQALANHISQAIEVIRTVTKGTLGSISAAI